jgi:hypothetical protein
MSSDMWGYMLATITKEKNWPKSLQPNYPLFSLLFLWSHDNGQTLGPDLDNHILHSSNQFHQFRGGGGSFFLIIFVFIIILIFIFT